MNSITGFCSGFWKMPSIPCLGLAKCNSFLLLTLKLHFWCAKASCDIIWKVEIFLLREANPVRFLTNWKMLQVLFPPLRCSHSVEEEFGNQSYTLSWGVSALLKCVWGGKKPTFIGNTLRRRCLTQDMNDLIYSSLQNMKKVLLSQFVDEARGSETMSSLSWATLLLGTRRGVEI